MSHDEEPPQKRFKYQSYAEELKNVHLPSTLSQSQNEQELGDYQSHFHDALEHWQQLNLSPAFIKFARQAGPLSASLPLLLHHWKDVLQLWVEAKDASDDEGLKALLDLLQKMLQDLRITLDLEYDSLLSQLLWLITRQLSSTTLTSLLTTFSSFFKHLLVPSTETPRLRVTWEQIRSTLTKCLPEVQRAMSEVWGGVIRRLKLPLRKVAIELLVNELSGVEDSVAWVFVSACKSVSQSLHTATESLVSPLIDIYVSYEGEDEALIFTLIRRVLTALVHHVKNAEQFSVLATLLIDKFSMFKTQRVIEALTVAISVRNGARFSQTQLSQVMEACLDLKLHEASLKLVCAILSAGEMPLWMSPGRKFLEYSWSNTKFAVQLHGALKELDWGGWKMIGLPSVLKHTQNLLEKEPVFGARLIASLDVKDRDVDIVWKKRVGDWASSRLSDGDTSSDVLKATVYCDAETSTVLVKRVESMLDREDATVLGSFLRSLAVRPTTEWNDSVDLLNWTRRVLLRNEVNAEILQELKLLADNSTLATSLSFDEIYPLVKTFLGSHSRALRLAVLRLLSSPLVDIPTTTVEVVKRCLQGEEVPLDVQGVRERIIRIGRIGQAVKDDDLFGIDICSRWLLAQLKVNLRPLWSPAIQALERFGEHIWETLFFDLQQVFRGSDHESTVSDRGEDINDPDDWEDERSWRDPSAHKLRSIASRWLKLRMPAAKGDKDRLDPRNYGLQLLAALAELSALAEKHNRDVVSLFLALSDEKRLPKKTLGAWLSVFANFVNPKACYATEQLQAVYFDILSYPDRSIQSESLACILSYKSKALTLRQDQLRGLLDNTRWRDELTSLELEEQSSEVVHVVIRILFGFLTEKRRRGGSGGILSAIARCQDEELVLLADLMLRPFGVDHQSFRDPFDAYKLPEGLTESQQIGFLTLLTDVLKALGPRLLPAWPALLGAVIDCTTDAQKKLTSQASTLEDEPPEDAEGAVETDNLSPSKLTRTVRQLGMRCYTDFFRVQTAFDFSPYLSTSFSTFISPRLDSMDRENTQATSALLELFFQWSEVQPLFLVDHDNRVLPKIYACMIATNVKPIVVSRIYDMIERLLVTSIDDSEIRSRVVVPHVPLLLKNLAATVDTYKSDTQLGQRHISIVSQLASYCEDAELAHNIVGLLVPLLKRSFKQVPDKVKSDLLAILARLRPLIADYQASSSPTFQTLYTALSGLFQSLRARQSRLSLCSLYRDLVSCDASLAMTGELLEDLNAYSAKRIDEPDFDRRLAAFARLNSSLPDSFSPSQWLPILYEMLYCIQDAGELAVRTSASSVLRLYINAVATDSSSEYTFLFNQVLLPALKNGLKAKSEPVRAEILGVISYSVSKIDHSPTLQDMRILLANGDEEANFFNNILHLQIHRRTRSLRRLADLCDTHNFRNATLTQILLPIATVFVTHPSTVDHHLVNEAIVTTGRLAGHLTWSSYSAMLRRYLKGARTKDDNERVYVRAVVSILENFHFTLDDAAYPSIHDPDEIGVLEDESETQPTQDFRDQAQRILDAVNTSLLPDLIEFLNSRDSTTEDTTRIPVAIGIAKVIKHMPSPIGIPQITKLLTVLSQVFRSKSQDVRDLTRDTMARIAVILGPSSLPIMIQELRGALTRGPHLHVLAFVTHTLLAHVTASENVDSLSDLDECVAGVAHVSAEVIFGESGKDVQAEGFKTKMREVRSSSSMGLDSFAILARHVTPGKIGGVLSPVRSILQETSSSRTLQQADEVLRRVAIGLNGNKHLVPTELLALCRTMITQNAKFLTEVPTKRKTGPKDDKIVQLKRKVEVEDDHYATNSYRFVAFGLELLHTALKRNRFDFKDNKIISRLESMVVAVGNTLYSTNSSVLALGLKSVSQLVKCPLKSLERSLPVFIRQALEIIKGTGNTESELAQVALRSLATILRDGPKVQVKERELVYLLELISPDLEEPERQNTVFTMLRSIVARKFVVPEIYDLMERVSEVMVTSQSSQMQELCRGVLLQFLLDYPQGKGRLKTQMTFLAKNLSYVHESGRRSAMELLGAILSKFQERLVCEYADILFVALVMVLANDESAKCKEMAAQLIKGLVFRLDDARKNTIMQHLHAWASQESQVKLMRVAAQVYGLVVDAFGKDAEPFIDIVLADVNGILQRSAASLQALEAGEDDQPTSRPEWQSPYYSMLVISKAIQAFPDRTETASWPAIVEHLLFPHAWVRNVSCRLLGVLFSTQSTANTNRVEGVTGKSMRQIADKLCSQLKSEHLDESLGTQIVKNLFFIGKRFYAQRGGSEDDEDAEDEQVDEASNDEEDEEAEPASTNEKNSLPWLFSKLSYQTRSAHIARRNRSSHSDNWTQQPLSILRWFAAMVTHMSSADVQPFLVHILTPVYRIVEDDSVRDPQMGDLKTLATELQDLIQSKVGAAAFSTMYNRIRQGAVSSRNERRMKRVMFSQNPDKAEAMAQRKAKKNSAKKESRKRKNAGFADGRGRVKKSRRED